MNTNSPDGNDESVKVNLIENDLQTSLNTYIND